MTGWVDEGRAVDVVYLHFSTNAFMENLRLSCGSGGATISLQEGVLASIFLSK